MTKRFGFTLAEVLITLGIIGVVAAMTIPTLVANTNGAKFRSQFKKTLSTLNQAGLMAQAQYDFDYAGLNAACNGTVANAAKEDPTSDLTMCALLNGTLTGHSYIGAASNLKDSASNAYKFNNAEGGKALTLNTADDYNVYTLADGSVVGFPSAMAGGCTLQLGQVVNTDTLKAGTKDETTGAITGAGGLNGCIGFIDVNGVTLPNKEVSCSGDGTAALTPETPCAVKNNATNLTDIFPVVFHDATVEPATNAAKYVLTSTK